MKSGGQAAAVVTDLSKAFDCIDHELLIAKLNAYGFDNSSLTFIYSFLSGRKQRTKINSSFSCWAEILFGVPQGSILGPFLFNAYICDLFFEVTSESMVKLLGIHIDNRLNFDYHVSQLCKKASKKLHALARIFKYVETSKRKILVNAFIISQFSYCPLIWMFHNRKMEHSINRIHERALCLIYPSVSKLTFKELLNKNKTVSIHQKNVQVLATEICKAKLNISPEISKELFSFNVR